MKQLGRRPGRTDTRVRILTSARRLFGERGYAGTTIRAIAADAGVNPALVHHFYGPKEQVFAAALSLPVRPADVLAMVADGPREEVGERVARFILSIWRDPATREPLLAVIRSAATSEPAAAMVREYLGSTLLARAAATLEANPLRLATAIGQAVGVMLLRYVIAIEPLASASDDEVVAMLAPTIQRHVTN
ncbi:MAG: TetR family transcriptional regulator [Mycobacteriales bacterium]|jgi:AcrR family transcriptional regulator